MKRFNITKLFLYFLISAILLSAFKADAHNYFFQKPDTASIEGRWDLTLKESGKEYPGWLEISHSGNHTLVGQVVIIVGSARPISKVNYSNGNITFSVPPQWESGDGDFIFAGTFAGDSLSGSMVSSDKKMYTWTGVRAPFLHKQAEPVWGKSITLFNGKDLTGWHATGENQWKAESGILMSPHSGSNLVSDETFKDFKLHIEFRYPAGSNSGVYLRGRYEVQIIDSKGQEPLKILLGAVYGFLTPNEMVAKDPGEWQSYDITLVGRLVTIVANGKTIICDQEIPGITGGAINSREAEPGPILIQGDHGPIDFRNIVITPAK